MLELVVVEVVDVVIGLEQVMLFDDLGDFWVHVGFDDVGCDFGMVVWC